MKLLRDTIWQADEGKVFKNKITEEIGCSLILLAIGDSIDNYEEIDEPTIEEPIIEEESAES